MGCDESTRVSLSSIRQIAIACVAKMPDHEFWIAAVRDPEGNTIGLMEERR